VVQEVEPGTPGGRDIGIPEFPDHASEEEEAAEVSGMEM